jgi:Barrel-sandwich domain of CusB or HlyD membrane-fusion
MPIIGKPDNKLSEAAHDSERVATLALELGSRAACSESLDGLYFLLTNDLHTLASFDRCLLITHLEGESRFVAATHHPMVEKKSLLAAKLQKLAQELPRLKNPLILSRQHTFNVLTPEAPPDGTLSALKEYGDLAGWNHLCCIPLNYEGAPVGHLLMEFSGDNLPDKSALSAVAKVAPIFGNAIVCRWLAERKPAITANMGPEAGVHRPKRKWATRRAPLLACTAAGLAALFFLVPFTFSVGGEAVIAPKERQYAFCKISGLIAAVDVRQGSQVEKGQPLATLDPRELDFRITREERQFELLTREMALSRSKAFDDPSMLAKVKLAELKREGVQAELEFLRWQRQFLVITAPVSGVIVTKDVETLVGKKLEAGEPFCEIAEPGLLCTEISVPEDRIMRVKLGQEAQVYLNNAPGRGYKIRVDEIAPRSEVEPRVGNVYKVTAVFVDSPGPIKVGMKGIAGIDTGTTNLWTILTLRLASRLNRLSLYFR